MHQLYFRIWYKAIGKTPRTTSAGRRRSQDHRSAVNGLIQRLHGVVIWLLPATVSMGELAPGEQPLTLEG